jgi:endonuclease/exonuclease/phosphatase (EEP) superfamily protein YafD
VKPVRILGAIIASLVLAGSVVLTLARVLDSESELWVLAAAFIPLALVGYLVAAALFGLLLWRRPWGRVRRTLIVLVSVCVIGAGLHAWWLSPAYVGSHPTGKPDLTVLELNMLKGRADPAGTAALLRRERPDLVVLTEVTPGALAAVTQAGATGRGSPLPYLAGKALPGAAGVVVASRFPLQTERTLPMRNSGYVVKVSAPDPFEVVAVHSEQPAIDIAGWRRDQDTILRQSKLLAGPRIVVGDLNATLDHPGLRRMLADGMADAARQANSGWQPTWPSPDRVRAMGVPTPLGLMAIDHVLVSGHFAAVSTTTPAVRRTDHRALVVRLVRR